MKAPSINHNGKTITLYEFFGVEEKATPEDLKVAYRKLCHQYHPDKNPEKKQAEENFKVVQAVWAILSNPSKRREYDERLAIERGQLQPVPQGFAIHCTWGYDTGTVANRYSSWWEGTSA